MDLKVLRLVPAYAISDVYFGAGCFWGVELAFQRAPGVLATAVGYSNGETDAPTYEEVCSGQTGHAEVVQVKYDPRATTLEALLELFFERHDPTQVNRQGNDVGTQYRSGVYYTTPAQQEAVESWMMEKQLTMGGAKIATQVAELEKYTSAESYHQQYLATGGRNGNGQSPAKGCTDPIRCYG